MHHYPTWKSVTVAVVMLLAFILALPNLFGESPALQLSRKDRANFDNETITQFQGVRKTQSVPLDEAHVDDAGRLWLRFANVQDQLKARDDWGAQGPGRPDRSVLS